MLNVNVRAPDAALYLELAESTLAKMRVRGDGPVYYKIGRAVVYAREELDRWLASKRRLNTSQHAPKVK